MGEYTQLVLGVELKKDTPQKIIERLEYMKGADPAFLNQHPDDNELWQCGRWEIMLRCGSVYFDWNSGFSLVYDEITDHYTLSGCSNLKNYNGEIAKFVLWLAPYVETPGFLGFTRHEIDEHPTLIYKWADDSIHFMNIHDVLENKNPPPLETTDGENKVIHCRV